MTNHASQKATHNNVWGAAGGSTSARRGSSRLLSGENLAAAAPAPHKPAARRRHSVGPTLHYQQPPPPPAAVSLHASATSSSAPLHVRRRNSHIIPSSPTADARWLLEMAERRGKAARGNKAMPPFGNDMSDATDYIMPPPVGAAPSRRSRNNGAGKRKPVPGNAGGRQMRQIAPPMPPPIDQDHSSMPGLAKAGQSRKRRRSRRPSGDSDSDDDSDPEGTELLIKIGRAFLARIIFVSHSLITIWQTVNAYENNTYWGFALISVAILLEGGYTIIMRAGDERKWFCPSVLLYILATAPPIWALELDMSRQREEQLDALPTVIASSIEEGKLESAEAGAGKVDHEISVQFLEQLLLVILIICRWLLPKGEISREQLSQILLAYLAISSDIVELFDVFKEDEVVRNDHLQYMVLTCWFLSLLQFPFVLTVSKARKMRVAITQSTSYEDIRRLQLKSEQGETTVLHQILHDVDIWAILMANMFQDVPFLIARLILMVGYRVITYTMIFFTCKNLLIIMLQSYRASVIIHDRYQKATPDEDVRRLIDHYCDSMIHSQRMLAELQERHADVFDRHEMERFGRSDSRRSDDEGGGGPNAFNVLKLRVGDASRSEYEVSELSEPLINGAAAAAGGSEPGTFDRKRNRRKKTVRHQDYDERSLDSVNSGTQQYRSAPARDSRAERLHLDAGSSGRTRSVGPDMMPPPSMRSRSRGAGGGQRGVQMRLHSSRSQDSFEPLDSPKQQHRQRRRPRRTSGGDLINIYEDERAQFHDVVYYEQPRKKVVKKRSPRR